MNKLNTMGGKEKPFKWIYENRTLKINKESAGKIVTVEYSYYEVLSVLIYLDKFGPLPLANSVSKLYNGVEKQGIGTFVYNNSEQDMVKAQSVSQLMPVLHELGLVEHNNKKRGILFNICNQAYIYNLNEYIKDRKEMSNPHDADKGLLIKNQSNDYYRTVFNGIEKTLIEQSEYERASFEEVFDPFKAFNNRMSELNDDGFYNMLVAVVFYSGFKAATVNKYMDRINYYFGDYKRVLNYDEVFIASIISDDKMLSNRSKIQACVKNATAISKTVKEYGSIKSYLDIFNAAESEDGMAKLMKDLRKRFSYLGEVTVFHLLTDLGFNVLKPDRVIMRILKRLELVEDINDFIGAIKVGQKFANATGHPIRYIDIILVSYGQLDLENLTSICTEVNPKCEVCGIREYCYY